MATPDFIVLKIRRNTLANLPILQEGEFYLATDTGDLYVGGASGNLKVTNEYSPATPGNWASAAPSTISSAIDRLAAAVHGLLGGVIP